MKNTQDNVEKGVLLTQFKKKIEINEKNDCFCVDWQDKDTHRQRLQDFRN